MTIITKKVNKISSVQQLIFNVNCVYEFGPELFLDFFLYFAAMERNSKKSFY